MGGRDDEESRVMVGVKELRTRSRGLMVTMMMMSMIMRAYLP